MVRPVRVSETVTGPPVFERTRIGVIEGQICASTNMTLVRSGAYQWPQLTTRESTRHKPHTKQQYVLRQAFKVHHHLQIVLTIQNFVQSIGLQASFTYSWPSA